MNSHLDPHSIEEAAEGEPPSDEVLTLPQIDHFGEHIDDLVKIPIEDNGEPLVDVFQVCPQLSWMTENMRFDFPRSGLGRESLAFMLRTAQGLLPSGVRLQVVGVLRSFAIQKQMYEIVKGEMREKHPDWDEEFLTSYVNVFSAPPILTTPPPHTTGGAVDLLLIDENGERLDMISPFEMGWDSAPMDMPGLSETARRNRDLLRDVLLEAGLTNFPGEWWHWSYGEPGWALRGGHPVALYGAVPEDKIPDWQPPV
ncbi:MAG TPA: M15 family metallopeptidase [Abditibacteriaceae bacterium]|jgi:D-alanyl-D-alanine dipeptidase